MSAFSCLESGCCLRNSGPSRDFSCSMLVLMRSLRSFSTIGFLSWRKEGGKKGILVKLNIAFNWIICTNTNPVMRLFWKKYLPCEQGSGVPCLLVQKQREPLLWSLNSGWRAGWIWAAFSSPLPLPCIYTPKSPYECVSLRLDGVSHSPRANRSAGKGFEERRAATCSMKCL